MTPDEVRLILAGELPKQTESIIPVDWLAEHWNDLDGYQPDICISSGGISHSMTFKRPSETGGLVRDLMKGRSK